MNVTDKYAADNSAEKLWILAAHLVYPHLSFGLVDCCLTPAKQI